MIAIKTKYIPPTNHKGPRIAATTCNGHRVVIDRPYNNTEELSHLEAANALCSKMGWTGRLVSGGTDVGYVFVFISRDMYNVFDV